MKSVVIFSGTPGRGSGAERVLEYLLHAPEVRAYIAGVITPSHSPVCEIARGFGLPVCEWSITNDSGIAAFRAVPTLLHNWRPPDGVRTFHAWHTRGFEVAGILGRHWKLTTCGTLHDHPKTRHSVPRRWLIRLAANKLNRLAVVSQALEHACSDANWSVPIQVIPNGLPDRPAAGARALSGVLRVGFVGVNGRWKGIELLRDVVARTVDLPMEWRLYGEPVEDTKPILSKILSESPNRVVHCGYRTPHEIFSEIDLLFHPSLEFDPYPTALLEAARAGIPAIASDSGGSAEIVQADVTGMLFQIGNLEAAAAAVRLVAGAPSRLEAMGRNARVRFEESFSLASMAQRYIQFWH